MNISEFVEQVICAARQDHKARKTWQCYAGHARRFATEIQSPLDALPAVPSNVVRFEVATQAA